MKTKKSKYLIPLISIVITLFAILLALVLGQYAQEQKVEGDLKEVEENKKYVEEILEDNKLSPRLVIVSDDIKIPDANSDLEDIEEELNNPEVLISFLNQHFKLDKELSFIAQDLNQFFNNKTGNALDVAVFSTKILHKKAPITGIIRYDYLNNKNEENSHFVAYFRASGPPRYISLNKSKEVEMYEYGRSFLDLIRNEEKRLDIKVLRYTHFSRDNSDFSDVVSPFTWQYID